MKLYTVWSGEYSDRTMHAIFISKEKADKYAEVYDKIDGGYDSYWVSEYETEDDNFDINTNANLFYYCSIQLQDYQNAEGKTVESKGDISSDEWWDEFMKDYGIKDYDQLKPSVIKPLLEEQGREMEDTLQQYGVATEYIACNKPSYYSVLTDGNDKPFSIQAYSQESYAHARKIAIEQYQRFTQQQLEDEVMENAEEWD